MAQKIWKKQKNSEDLKKKNPTKKEMLAAIQFLSNKMFQFDNLFALYLEWKKEKNKFNKYITNRFKEQEKHKESTNGSS